MKKFLKMFLIVVVADVLLFGLWILTGLLKKESELKNESY